MSIKDMLVVGMADMKCAKHPAILTTLGLGSCVGIALYDPTTKVVGMAHCMLPDSMAVSDNRNIAKFVDTAVVRLVNDMGRLGANKSKIQAKIAGGAQMFAFDSKNDALRIGDRNVEATKNVLRQMNIPIIKSETGEFFGRTIELYSDDGRLFIKTVGHGSRTL